MELSASTLASLTSKVKVANQRLRQAEKDNLTNTPAYKYIAGLHFDNVSFMGTDKNGKMKFRTDIKRLSKENTQGFYDYMNAVDKFLNAKSSTKKGMMKMHKENYNTFKENHPEFTGDFNDYCNMWENARDNAVSYASDVIIKSYTMAKAGNLKPETVNKIINKNTVQGKKPIEVFNDINERIAKNEKARNKRKLNWVQRITKEGKNQYDEDKGLSDEQLVEQLPFNQLGRFRS